MLLSLVYFVLRRLLSALTPSDRSDLEREAELLVLRHQLKVLSRPTKSLDWSGTCLSDTGRWSCSMPMHRCDGRKLWP